MSRNVLDGLTRKGYIASVERLHDELEFTYRPLLAEQAESIRDASQTLKPAALIALISASLAKQIESWSEVDANNKAVPINSENIRRMQPAVLYKLRAIIEGSRASDPRAEDKSTSNNLDEYASELMAIVGGSTPIDEQLKN